MRRSDPRDQGAGRGRAVPASPSSGRSSISTWSSRTRSETQAELLAAGFVPTGDAEFYAAVDHHLQPLRSPRFPIDLEIHDRPKWVDGLDPPAFGELAAGAAPTSFGVEGILDPAPARHALVLAAHLWSHEPFTRLLRLLDIVLYRASSRSGGARVGCPGMGSAQALELHRCRDGRRPVRRAAAVASPGCGAGVDVRARSDRVRGAARAAAGAPRNPQRRAGARRPSGRRSSARCALGLESHGAERRGEPHGSSPVRRRATRRTCGRSSRARRGIGRDAERRAADPDVTVVVATRNRAALLPYCLASLVEQETSSRFEVVVVDNGSEDGTADVIRGWASATRGFAVCSSLPSASAGRRTRASEEARGELVLFTDDDVILDSAWIEAYVSFFARRRHEPRTLVGGPVLPLPHDLSAWPTWLDEAARVDLPGIFHGSEERALGRFDYIWGANMAARGELFAELGGFDEGLGRSDDVRGTLRGRRAERTRGRGRRRMPLPARRGRAPPRRRRAQHGRG